MFHCAMADIDLASRTPRIELAAMEDFSLGGLRVRPSLRRVEMAGETRDLAPRVMQVLSALASARPSVLSRDRLIELCWDGRIVGDDALNRCILALRNLARSFSPEPFAIETVPRVGHRLIAATAVDSGAGDRTAPTVPVWRRRSRAMLLLAALAILLIATASVWLTVKNGQARAPASIAVLPFRNLSSGDPYFAEGIGEEILSQLGRQTDFRVIGRTSAVAFRNATDLRDVGRKLGVDYILEGSVRTQGERVRVNATLVQASSGVQLWSDSYDRNLDDIFAIQNAIGESVAGSLERTIFKAAPLAGALVTRGDIYQLHLRARGIIRTRDGRLGQAAVALLREVIRRDPGYAPGWSSLAQAMRLNAEMGDKADIVTATRQAERYARHALALAPDLAEAHGVLGMLLGFSSPEAQYHIRRAAALDPNNGEIAFWLGNVEGNSANFVAQRAAYQRTAAIDPFWFRSVEANTEFEAGMGRRAAAEAIAIRKTSTDPSLRHMLLAQIAMIYGDFSDAVRHYAKVAKTDPRCRELAEGQTRAALLLLGLTRDHQIPPWNDFGRLLMVAPPSPEKWRRLSGNVIAADVQEIENQMAAKLMLNAGRATELVATHDSAAGLLGLRQGQPLAIARIKSAPLVALALRRDGRGAEADRLLADADVAIRAVYRRGPVPFRFDADAAAVAAVRGQKRQALALLERAYAHGWRHIAEEDLPRLSAEPAFAALHDEPRFKGIEARLDAWFAREKQETAAVVVSTIRPLRRNPRRRSSPDPNPGLWRFRRDRRIR